VRVGSLFAGIGGFDLGLERAGMRTVFQVEIDRRCGELLNAHWPEVPLHIDIKEVIVKPWRLTEEQKRSAVVMYEAGLSCAQVGDYFGVSRQSAWDVLRRRTTMRPRERHGSDNHFWRGTSDDDRAQNIVEKALECERLQGFPDYWTEGFSDNQRYRMLGNAVAVPVVEWIGRRIMAEEAA